MEEFAQRINTGGKMIGIGTSNPTVVDNAHSDVVGDLRCQLADLVDYGVQTAYRDRLPRRFVSKARFRKKLGPFFPGNVRFSCNTSARALGASESRFFTLEEDGYIPYELSPLAASYGEDLFAFHPWIFADWLALHGPPALAPWVRTRWW